MNVEHRTSNTERRNEDEREAHMENLYGWICRQADERATVDALEDYALRDLLGWLARLNILTGIPGMVYGHCLVEAARRFAENTEPTTSNFED